MREDARTILGSFTLQQAASNKFAAFCKNKMEEKVSIVALLTGTGE